jgi:GAF domain-containing protein
MQTSIVKIDVPEGILNNWQEIADILAQMLDIPAALVMRLNDPHIEVLVSSNSEGNPYHPGDHEVFEGSGLYCERVVKTQDKHLVPDAPSDSDWADNPDIKIKINMISYLGFPLCLPDSTPFGTLCVLDNKPNAYNTLTEKIMLKFCSIIESELGMVYMNQVLGDRNKRLNDYLDELQALRGMVDICMHCKSIKNEVGEWVALEKYLGNNPNADLSHCICPECMEKEYSLTFDK